MEELYALYQDSTGVCTDTRKLLSGQLFFALKGPNFDGNSYASKALEAGARAAVVDRRDLQGKPGMYFVEDVLKTLQDLGTHHRRQMPARVIALTGSNGKTTTKELITAVLSTTYKTQSTQGNLNNHIGVPLTLLSLKKETEYLVVEMGANHQGEIASLSAIAEPDLGLITNYGKAHLEGFGGVEGVIKGKSELFEFLKAHKRHVFMRADDPIQQEKLADYVHKIGYTEHDNPDFYRIERLEKEGPVSLQLEGIEIRSQLPGAFNFYNCAMAALIGRYFNVPLERIKGAIESYLPDNMRSQIMKKGSYTVLLDAYNANPSSMAAAIESLLTTQAETRVAILGDMLELGEDSIKEHQSMGDLLEDERIHTAFLIGPFFQEVKSRHRQFANFEEFRDSHMVHELPEDSLILIKGSRAMKLERVLDVLDSPR